MQGCSYHYICTWGWCCWDTTLRSNGILPNTSEARVAESLLNFDTHCATNESSITVPRFYDFFSNIQLSPVEVDDESFDEKNDIVTQPNEECIAENIMGILYIYWFLMFPLYEERRFISFARARGRCAFIENRWI